MNFKMIFHILGKVLYITAILMLLPLIVAFIYGEKDTYIGFVVPILVLLSAGIPLEIFKPKNTLIFAKEGLTSVALAWIVTSLIGALPFYISRYIPSFLDSVFETVSGFTTTGASILTDVEMMPYSLLFWRSFTHWIGGMGVLVFILAVIPKTDMSMMHLLRAEAPGPVIGKLVAKMRLSARILYGIYVLLTVILIIFLVAGKMPFFDSVVTSFATAGTGGFGIKNNSIAFYDSAYIDIVLSIFMILFGVNFNIYYLMLLKNFKRAFKNDELRWYLSIIIISVVAVAINIYSIYPNIMESLRHSFFQVSSIITTTGFTTADFDQWPMFSKTAILLLMVIGSSAGSTGGGMKVSRIVILFKSVRNSIKSMANPRSVSSINLSGEIIDSKTEKSVLNYFALYMLIAVTSVVILSFDQYDGITNISAVLACLNNVGPGLRAAGPLGNYSGFSSVSKIILILNMLIGRLEIYPVIVLFSPLTWKRR